MSRVAHANRLRRPILVAISGLLVAAANLFVSVVPAAASTFTVGGCSYSTLIADIEAANSEIDYPGGDTINLAGSCTFQPSPAYGDTVFAFPPITSDIIIDGHGAEIRMADGADARSFFNVRDGAVLVLANLTLADADGQNSTGASVHNRGSVTLSNVTLTHRVPFGQTGAGIYNDNTGVLAVLSSTIENQSCQFCGGGIYNAGQLTVSHTTFRSNTREGSIANGGTAEVFDSTFTGDTDSSIANAGSLRVHDSSFVSNSTQVDGGAIDNLPGGDLFVERSYFGANRVEGEGGAIFNAPAATASVLNSTFYDNIAASRFFSCCAFGTGGAISNHGGLALDHVSFLGNGAGTGSSLASPEGSASVHASLFDGVLAAAHCSGNVVDGGANVVDSISSGCPSTFAVGDARLMTPAINGFGTKTAALGAGSAALDVVSAVGCPTYDQRGVLRPVGAACDAGAFEDQRPNVPGAPAETLGTNPTNGGFTLGWTAATDPDGTTPAYRLFRRDADDAHDTQIGTPTTNAANLSSEPEGTFRYSVASDDGNLFSSKSALSDPIVVDRTPPTAPSRSADRSPEGGSWFRDTVTVSFSGSTDPDLPDGSPGSGVAFTTAPITKSTSGVFPLVGIARDAAGNESDETRATVRVDADSPTVGFAGCARDVILKSTAAASWSASDPSSGISGATSGSVPLDTSTLGSRTASVKVSDLVGHEATATCAYRVIYDFSGFFAPLANPPKLVDVRAGDTISIVFGLGGDQGLGVLAATPVSAPVDCVTPGEPTGGEPTAAARSLSYQTALGGRYRYQWVTPKTWKGTCRQVIVTLIDGTTHRANVRFN